MRRKLRVVLVGMALGLGLLAWQTGPTLIAQRRSTRLAAEEVGGAELRGTPGLRPNEYLLFNGWGVTPAGEHVPMGDMPLKLALSPDGRTLAAVTGGFNDTGLVLVDIAGRRVAQSLPLRGVWNGLAFNKDGTRIFVSGASSGRVRAFRYENGKAEEIASVAPAGATATGTFLAGIAVHPGTGKLYVCNEGTQEVWALNPETLQRETTVVVGLHPHSCAFGADGRHLYVSNWGSRSVSVVDSETNSRVRDLEVGLRPNDLALAPDGRLFVACSGDNTVHVIQTRSLETQDAPASPTRRLPESVREIISTSLYPSSPEGSTPDGVAVSPDGKTLFVANADNNDVLVGDISDPEVTRVSGFIPAGWYPTAVAVSPDNGTLFVANGKGLHSRENYPAQTPRPTRLHRPPGFDYIGTLFRGSVSFVRRPSAAELTRYTQQVRANSPYTPDTLRRAPMASESVIPDQVGKPCPIQYVLYIIKENRTYDQVFGAFKDARGRPAGNGDPRLVMFGEDVTANHHQLARDYVLLDNLYCNGEVSVDGHSWCDAAIATDYNQRDWIMSYSGHGTLPGNAEMETPAAGYLWDLCRRHGLSFRCYGEGNNQVPTTNRGTWSGRRDMERAEGWIRDFKAAEATGELPRFTIMSLGEDHTAGTTPGRPTPDAAVASNDIALGKIVETASRSRFWREMAIFVIEDDAQNGPDHVDAHRTVGLVISPWAKRGVVDSTFYTTASMVRTMELILGLPPLTQYDAGATPMFNSFQKRAQLVAYQPRTPKVDVAAINQRNAPGAQQSKRMNFDEYDRAPEDELNRILWRATRGPGVPYPAPIHRAVFTSRR
jgi:YVTN family beta-propeller protein